MRITASEILEIFGDLSAAGGDTVASLMKKTSKPDVNEAASALGKRSAEVRKAKWGKKEFKKRMKEYGKLGGRPRKGDKKEKGKQ